MSYAYSWQRPKTTRRYLQPPKAERLFTLWTEGKLHFAELTPVKDNFWRNYALHDCSAMWLVHTKYAQMFDFRNAECFLPDDGTPIHGLKLGFGGFDVTFEAFCNSERKASCFAKITVANTADFSVRDKMGIALRSGKEKQILFGSPDEYFSYAPEISAFKALPCTFTEENGILWDNDVFVAYQSRLPLSFDAEQGILWADLKFAPGESADIVLSFGKGKPFAFDYETEKQKTANY